MSLVQGNGLVHLCMSFVQVSVDWVICARHFCACHVCACHCACQLVWIGLSVHVTCSSQRAWE